MTPFETQVAEALKALHTTWAFSSKDFELSNALAPRVAAAIEAAIRKATEWDHADRVGDGISAGNAALAALRGETP